MKIFSYIFAVAILCLISALIAASFYQEKTTTSPPITSKLRHVTNPEPVRGEAIYRHGNLHRGIPACIACHGLNGMGNAQTGFPRLAGQHALYTFNQLKAFKDRTRKNDLQAVMQDISSRLSEEEMKALSVYIQSLN